jgi:trehalose synthase
VIYENAVRNHLDQHNFVIVHDPQPLPLIHHYKKRGPWIWRCHLDLTAPHQELWDYLHPTMEKYDAVILSLKDYRQNLKTPQVFIFKTARNGWQDKVDEETARRLGRRGYDG